MQNKEELINELQGAECLFILYNLFTMLKQSNNTQSVESGGKIYNYDNTGVFSIIACTLLVNWILVAFYYIIF